MEIAISAAFPIREGSLRTASPYGPGVTDSAGIARENCRMVRLDKRRMNPDVRIRLNRVATILLIRGTRQP